jgi:hypothetical protein
MKSLFVQHPTALHAVSEVIIPPGIKTPFPRAGASNGTVSRSLVDVSHRKEPSCEGGRS